MAKPTKPTAPLPALRSLPDMFSERFENWILYSIETFPDYADAIADFADQQGDEALAAAIAAAAGNLSDAQRAAFAGGVVGISEATGNPLEAVDIVEIEAATTAQAQAGTATGVYMDPALTRAAIDARVPALIAGAAEGSIGSYAFLGTASTSETYLFGETRAGSGLFPAGLRSGSSQPFSDSLPNNSGQHSGQDLAMSGTWMCMGVVRGGGTQCSASLWKRIS